MLNNINVTEFLIHYIHNYLNFTINILFAIGSYVFVSKLVTRFLNYISYKKSNLWSKTIIKDNSFRPLYYILPAVFVYNGLKDFPVIFVKLAKFFEVYFILSFTLQFHKILQLLNKVYDQMAISKIRPIKGYVQLVAIIAYIIAAILSLAAILDKSPWGFLSGLGALTAFIAIIFRDTLLSLIAGIQITSNNLIQRDDWIEVPQFGANGNVVDESLNFIKVQNFDKTEVLIPTYKLIETGFKNWRGMYNANARRIRASFYIDQGKITNLEPNELNAIYNHALVKEFLPAKEQFIADYGYNNLSLYRHFIINYLKQHSDIASNNFTLIVNLLEPTPTGVPLQIYTFTKTTDWGGHEEVKSKIFEHILATIKIFNLAVYQRISNENSNAIK